MSGRTGARAGFGSVVRRPRALLLGVLCVTTHAAAAVAQPRAADPAAAALPGGNVFVPLLADPKRPGFVASLLWASSEIRSTEVAAVAFGEDIGIVRWGTITSGLQLGLSGGVFAQFDLRTESFDLMNADYVIGVPLTARRGRLSARLRLYHQSSHLGDEYLLREQPERVNLSFEAVETLVSADFGPLRVYVGGEWVVRREPEDYGRGLLHLGAEYLPSRPLLRAGSLGTAHLVLALDAKAWEQHDWSWAGSGRAGIEMRPRARAPSSRRSTTRPERSWSLLLELYDGPSPYGQFYTEHIQYVGLGLHLNL